MQCLGHKELVIFSKLETLFSPENNSSNYRKKLKKSNPPLVPFLGVHLGDIYFLNEAKKKELSKGEFDLARQRESQISEHVDKLLEYQMSCNYDFEIIQPVVDKFQSKKYITELQTFLEDLHYKLSYELEPKTSKIQEKDATETVPKIALEDSVDSLSASLENISQKNIFLKERKSIDTNFQGRKPNFISSLGKTKDNRGKESLENIDDSERRKASSSTGSFISRKTTIIKELLSPFNNQIPDVQAMDDNFLYFKRNSFHNSVGRKKGLNFKEIAEDSDLKSEIPREKSKEFIMNFKTEQRHELNYQQTSTHGSVFDAIIMLKQGQFLQKQCLIAGKAATNRSWEQYWYILYSNLLQAYHKKPATLNSLNTNPCHFFVINSGCSVEIAVDYKKPNVWRLTLNNGEDIMLFQMKNERETLEWVTLIQSCISTIKSQS